MTKTGTPLSQILADGVEFSALESIPLDSIYCRVRLILDNYDEILPLEKDPEKILAKMLRLIETWDWSNVPLSFPLQVARFVFSQKNINFNIKIICDFLLKEILSSTKSGFLNSMVGIYIETFSKNNIFTPILGEHLFKSRLYLGHQFTNLLTKVPNFFDASTVVTTIAEFIENVDDPWESLKQIGIRHPHAPGLMSEVHSTFVRQIAPKLQERFYIDKLFTWLAPRNNAPLQNGASEALNAIMSVWEKDEPDKEIKKYLIDRITALYGHPQVGRSPVWAEVSEENERRLLHWIMGNDIRFLFQILAEVEKRHMWHDRENFWWTMYESGKINGLWIAFNPVGFSVAKKRLKTAFTRFAEQTGESDKSLLIMHIGNNVVVEGTYNFQIHIFNDQDPEAPKLYKPKYNVNSIREKSAKIKIMHQGKGWMDKVYKNL